MSVNHGDVMARDSQASAGYWEIVQDALADVVRVMLSRCFDAQQYPTLAAHCTNLRGEMWVCAFPNLFVTVAPAEWKFPIPYFLQAYSNFLVAGAYIMALHMFEYGIPLRGCFCNKHYIFLVRTAVPAFLFLV